MSMFDIKTLHNLLIVFFSLVFLYHLLYIYFWKYSIEHFDIKEKESENCQYKKSEKNCKDIYIYSNKENIKGLEKKTNNLEKDITMIKGKIYTNRNKININEKNALKLGSVTD